MSRDLPTVPVYCKRKKRGCTAKRIDIVLRTVAGPQVPGTTTTDEGPCAQPSTRMWEFHTTIGNRSNQCIHSSSQNADSHVEVVLVRRQDQQNFRCTRYLLVASHLTIIAWPSNVIGRLTLTTAGTRVPRVQSTVLQEAALPTKRLLLLKTLSFKRCCFSTMCREKVLPGYAVPGYPGTAILTEAEKLSG
eukprot:2556645-Rhodomonas_salina.3